MVRRRAVGPSKNLRVDDAPVHVRWVVGVGSEETVTVGVLEADSVTNLVAGLPVDLQVQEPQTGVAVGEVHLDVIVNPVEVVDE